MYSLHGSAGCVAAERRRHLNVFVGTCELLNCRTGVDSKKLGDIQKSLMRIRYMHPICPSIQV